MPKPNPSWVLEPIDKHAILGSRVTHGGQNFMEMDPSKPLDTDISVQTDVGTTVTTQIKDLPGPIHGQFAPENLRTQVKTSFSQRPIPGLGNTNLQWAHGVRKVWTFTTTYFDNVQPTDPNVDLVVRMYSRLRQATTVFPNLGRPMKWLFKFGTIEFECFIESVGNIRFSDAVDENGRPISAKFDIRLLELEMNTESTAARVSVGDNAEVGPLQVFLGGDTFETIAKLASMAPMTGVPLRQASPEAFPGVGRAVRLMNFAGPEFNGTEFDASQIVSPNPTSLALKGINKAENKAEKKAFDKALSNMQQNYQTEEELPG